MKKGFTLIELMIVIAIIGILISIIVPNVIAYRNRSKQSSDIVIIDKHSEVEDVKTPEPVKKAVKAYSNDQYGDMESKY